MFHDPIQSIYESFFDPIIPDNRVKVHTSGRILLLVPKGASIIHVRTNRSRDQKCVPSVSGAGQPAAGGKPVKMLATPAAGVVIREGMGAPRGG